MEAGLLLVAVIWGLNFSVMKLGLGEIAPMAFNALRFPLAAVTAALMLRAQGRRMLPQPKDWRVVAALGVLGHVLYQACFVSALNLSLSGNAALVLSTAPLWVMLISVLLRQEKANPMALAGGATTLAGMVLVIAGGPAALGFSLRGDLLMILSAILWAFYLVLSRPATQRHGALEMTAWTLWAATPLVVLLGAKDLARMDWGSVSLAAWASVAYSSVFTIAVAYFLWYRAVAAIGQSRAAVYVNVVPVVALAAAWLWLGETPAFVQVAGAAVILCGLLVSRRRPRPRTRKPIGPATAAGPTRGGRRRPRGARPLRRLLRRQRAG